VLALDRLRFAQGEPIARMRNHLPADVFGPAGSSTEELESDGLYRTMRAAGVRMHSARQTIGARTATPAEAAELAEPPGAPLLTMQRITFDERGRAVEFASHLYRASRYTFEFSLLARS
jgi:DNA-binding GntR family transcriptional regulator